VVGGLVGYAIGYFFFHLIGEPIVSFYGYGERFEDATQLLNEWGIWVLIAKGLSPFPYKVLTIAAGASKMDLGPFILASIVSRAMRFYLVAALLFWFGESVRDFIERRFNVATTFLVLLIGGFVAIKYMF
jgi:membrane protein YqaA with SNARE-associated domain